MPFKSKSQSRLMHAVAGNPKLGKQLGIPQSTAKKMVKESQSSLKKLPNKVRGKM